MASPARAQDRLPPVEFALPPQATGVLVAQRPMRPGNVAPGLVIQGFPTQEFATPAQTSPVPDRVALQPPRIDYNNVERDDSDTIQDSPAAQQSYRPYNDRFPEYLYDLNNYYQPAIGPQAYADYAPRGYVEREFQDAPGAPEYTLLTPPVPVTQEERNKYVVGGFAPGSYLAPGTNTSFRLRGFVRLGGMFDFDPIGSRDDFVTNTIPVPQQVGQNQNFSARFSRLAVDTWTPTTFNDWNVHTFLEGDFFNGPAQAVGGGGNPFRLRFAFVDFGYFRLGQQNSVFMDSSSFPSTVDFAGPRGLVNLRRPSARMTLPLGLQTFWAIGVEQPFSDITTAGQGIGVQDVPDLATHWRWEGNRGSHIQVSGVARAIGYRPTGGDTTRRTGLGLNLTTNFHPWAILFGTDPVHDCDPSGLTRSRVLLQSGFGRGIGRYIQDTAALGLDGQVDPISGAFNAIDTFGWSTTYEHWFNAYWLTNWTYSQAQADSFLGQPGTTYERANYLAASLWWIPVTNLSFGIEYNWGDRENLNTQDADARRLGCLAQCNF